MLIISFIEIRKLLILYKLYYFIVSSKKSEQN